MVVYIKQTIILTLQNFQLGFTIFNVRIGFCNFKTIIYLINTLGLRS